MGVQGLFTRRQLMRAGAALTATGSISGIHAPVWSAEAKKKQDQVNVINPSGLDRLIMQNLLNELQLLNEFGLEGNFLNVGDGAKILAGLISGSADICTGAGVTGLFPAQEKGAALKIFAGGSIKLTIAIFAKGDDIKEAKDLVGKHVGVGAPGALLHSLMVALLTKEGVDHTTVNFVNVGSSVDVFKAVLAGTVDAGPGEYNYVEQRKKYGVHLLKNGALWESLPEYTSNCIFATAESISTKRDILVRTLAAHAKLFRYMTSPQSKEAFFKARAEALGKDQPEEAESHWKFYQLPGALANDLVLSEQRINYLQQLNIDLGVQQTMLPFDRVADMSLAEEALKLAS